MGDFASVLWPPVWDQGSRWALPVANCISRFSLKSAGPGGIRSAWDQGAKREESLCDCLKQFLGNI